MKYKKNIITFILFFVVAGVAFSQGLTKAQMCEDFVFLYKKLKDLNRTECTLDATNTNKSNWLSFFHDNMEIPVDLTLEESINRAYYTGKYFDENYLYNVDPVFKKILKLK